MPPSFGPDWIRIKRWCLLGAFAMVIWLLVPTVQCSWVAYRDTPISSLDESSAPSQTDAERVAEGRSFFDKMTSSVKTCYAKTPLLGQESWKSTVLLVLAGGTVLAWALARHEASRKRTIG